MGSKPSVVEKLEPHSIGDAEWFKANQNVDSNQNIEVITVLDRVDSRMENTNRLPSEDHVRHWILPFL